MSTTFSIANIVRRWASETPDAACLTQRGHTRTWGETYERSMRASSGLLDAGVEPGDRVAYMAKNDRAYFETTFAISMIGGASLGVNFRLAPPEMLQVLNHARAKVLLVGVDFLPQLAQFVDELDSVEKVVVLGDANDSQHESYEDWIMRFEPGDSMVPIAPDDTVTQGYTSGTTGLPKGVMFSNAAVEASLLVADDLDMRRESVVMVGMPLFHSSGSSWGTFSLATGCHCVIMPDLDPAEILTTIEQDGITKTMLVPVLLQALVGLPERETTDLSSLETIIYAGSPISPHLLKTCVDAFGCDFAQIYGMTETQTATILSPEDHRDVAHPERLASAGRASTGVTIRVVDPLTGIDQPEGVVGEVWIKAPTNTHGYWANPAETAAAITADGFVRTGDGAAMVDGYLFLRDRIKDMIVTGGENVYPIEVENVLSSFPGITDAAVIGVPSGRWGETVKAIVVTAPGLPPDAAAIISETKKHLAGYKCPTSVDFVDELPRNPSGKILKHRLREPYWAGLDRSVN